MPRTQWVSGCKVSRVVLCIDVCEVTRSPSIATPPIMTRPTASHFAVPRLRAARCARCQRMSGRRAIDPRTDGDRVAEVDEILPAACRACMQVRRDAFGFGCGFKRTPALGACHGEYPCRHDRSSSAVKSSRSVAHRIALTQPSSGRGRPKLQSRRSQAGTDGPTGATLVARS